MRIGRAVSSCSLTLLLFTGMLGVDYGELARKLRAAQTPEAKLSILSPLMYESGVDDELSGAIALALDASQEYRDEAIAQAVGLVEIRALLERARPPDYRSDPRAEAAAIKRNPLFRDPGMRESSNWIARAFERLAKLFRPPELRVRPPMVRPPNAALDLIVLLAWIAIGVALAAFLFFSLRHFVWKRRLTRKPKALLEEDEPERTLDEWLAMAARLESVGKYREAVRCLYLAILLNFDEKGIARFDRGQTNWEHLARIEASPKFPSSLDFREPTRQFDRVWYGLKVRGRADVDQFRQWYSAVSEALKERAA